MRRYEVLMDDCAAVLAETARAAGTREFRFSGQDRAMPLRRQNG